MAITTGFPSEHCGGPAGELNLGYPAGLVRFRARRRVPQRRYQQQLTKPYSDGCICDSHKCYRQSAEYYQFSNMGK